jgi:hypothetical protein
MLAILAKLLNVGRRQTAPLPLRIVSSNDRQSDGQAAARQRRRPALLCRWRLGEDQRLVCTWHDESLDVIRPAAIGRLRRT